MKKRRGASQIPMMAVHGRAMLQKRRGASRIPDMRLRGRGVPTLIPRMTPNTMTKRMFFPSVVCLLE